MWQAHFLIPNIQRNQPWQSPGEAGTAWHREHQVDLAGERGISGLGCFYQELLGELPASSQVPLTARRGPGSGLTGTDDSV